MKNDNTKHSENMDKEKEREELKKFEEKTGIKLGEQLGKGGFAVVYLGTKKSSYYAIKKIDLTNENKAQINRLLSWSKNEIQVTSNLRNKNCIKCLGVYDFPNTKILILEYAANRDLYFLTSIFYKKKLFKLNCVNSENINIDNKYYWTSTMSESFVRFFVNQIIVGLDYLNEMSFIHRDIKLDNILLMKNFQIKLSDFALSCNVPSSGEYKLSNSGTAIYMSPENFNKDISTISSKDAFKLDYYALGVLLFKMLTNEYIIKPENKHVEFSLLLENLKQKLDHNYLKKFSFSPKLIELLTNLLNVDIKKRANLKEIKENGWHNLKINEIRTLYEFHDNDYIKFLLELQKMDFINHFDKKENKPKIFIDKSFYETKKIKLNEKIELKKNLRKKKKAFFLKSPGQKQMKTQISF